MTSRYLIYGLVDPRSKIVQYVGRSSSGPARPGQHRSYKSHGETTELWLQELFASGGDYTIVVLEEIADPKAPSDRCWWWTGLNATALCDAERWWIAFFGRVDRSTGVLTNETDGGRGGSPHGDKHPSKQPKSRAKRSAEATVRWADPEFKARATAAITEAVNKPEVVQARQITSAKHAENMKSLWQDPAFAARMKTALNTPEAQARRAAIARQEPHADGTRAVMEILGIKSKQGVWYYDAILQPQIVGGRRVYDLDRVRVLAARLNTERQPKKPLLAPERQRVYAAHKFGDLPEGWCRAGEVAVILQIVKPTVFRFSPDRLPFELIGGARAYRLVDVEYFNATRNRKPRVSGA